MANEKSTKTPLKHMKVYIVTFSGITDKKGDLRLKGSTVTADELPDPDFQLSIGAIAEMTAETAKTEESKGEAE
jgi:hypothetical protein